MEQSTAIGKLLDDVGRTQDAEIYSKLNELLVSYLQQYPGQQAGFLSYLVGSLTFVYDANIVQKALRYELREQRPSDLIAAARSKFITPLSPIVLDDEIAEHAAEIAKDCNTTTVQVLNHYLFKVRPHLRLVTASDMNIFNEVRATIRDADDAHYVAVHFERKTFGIVTEDGDIKEFIDKEESFAVDDVCKINIIYRKQCVVLYFSIFNIAVFFSLVAGIFMILKKMWKVIIGIAAFLGVFMLLLRLFDKKRFEEVAAGLREQLGVLQDGIAKIWNAVKPFAAAYITECLQRTHDFQKKIGSLPQEGTILTKGKHIDGAPLTYVGLIKMIVLTSKKAMIREKDICAVFSELGYKVKGKESHRTQIRLALKNTYYFTRLKGGQYTLASSG